MSSSPFSQQHSDILDLAPDTPEGITKLVLELKTRGNAAFKRSSLKEAEILYSRAIGLALPGDLGALYGNRCAARLGMRAFPEALEDADQACAAGWAKKGLFRRGQCLVGMEKWVLAAEALEECLKGDPTNGEVRKELERVRGKQREEEEEEMVVEDVSERVKMAKKKAVGGKEINTDKINKDEVMEGTAMPKKAGGKEKKNANKDETRNADKDEKMAGEGTEVEGEETIMRGYKTLEDGRKTTFFHREIDPEEKAKLAAENKPTLIQPQAAAVAPTKTNGTSAWNAAGTYEERDMTKWATTRLKELLKNTSTVFENEGASGIVKVTGVSDIDGFATISFIRGSKRSPFDFTMNVDWSAAIEEGEIVGKLSYSYFSSESQETEAEVRWENRSKAGKRERPLMEHLRKEFRKAVDEKLIEFTKEFKALL